MRVSLIGSDSGIESTVISPGITTTGANDLLTGFARSPPTLLSLPKTALPCRRASPIGAGRGDRYRRDPGHLHRGVRPELNQTWQSAIVAAALNNPNQVTVSCWPTRQRKHCQYLVWRCGPVSCSNFVLVGTTPTASSSFIDTGLTPSTSYTYQVQAEDSTFTLGNFSSQMTIITPAPTPSLPGNLTVSASSSTQNNLSWTASLETAGGTISSYLVESCQGAGCTGFTQIGTSPTATYTDSTVTANTSYTYRVRAKDSAGVLSPYSNVATDVTPGP